MQGFLLLILHSLYSDATEVIVEDSFSGLSQLGPSYASSFLCLHHAPHRMTGPVCEMEHANAGLRRRRPCR